MECNLYEEGSPSSTLNWDYVYVKYIEKSVRKCLDIENMHNCIFSYKKRIVEIT